MSSALCLLPTLVLLADEEPAKPTKHQMRMIEGWRVQIDERLLEPANEATHARAVQLLAAKLADIASLVEEDRLTKLRAVTIWMDLSHGKLTSMQYHPSAGWLMDNGYSPALAKGVHIPVAGRMIDPQHNRVQPWCVLHELAHAYHDQVLGFEEPRVKEVWNAYVKSGRGDSTPFITGGKRRHYALTNQKEFFAEMSEAYFGTNDFFPFVHGELQSAEPDTFAALSDIWGPLGKKRK